MDNKDNEIIRLEHEVDGLPVSSSATNVKYAVSAICGSLFLSAIFSFFTVTRTVIDVFPT